MWKSLHTCVQGVPRHITLNHTEFDTECIIYIYIYIYIYLTVKLFNAVTYITYCEKELQLLNLKVAKLKLMYQKDLIIICVEQFCHKRMSYCQEMGKQFHWSISLTNYFHGLGNGSCSYAVSIKYIISHYTLLANIQRYVLCRIY